MDIHDVLDALEEIVQRIEDLEKIEELLDRIDDFRNGLPPDGQAPDPQQFAQLLGDILRCVIELAPLPDKLKKALDLAIDYIEYVVDLPVNTTAEDLCRDYFRWRQAGFDHEEAIEFVSLDPLIRAWLKLKWDLDQLPEGEEGEGDDNDEDGEVTRPPIVVPSGPAWGFEHDACCAAPPQGQGGGAIQPEISANNPVWQGGPQDLPWKFTVSLETKHLCGIASFRVQFWVAAGSMPPVRLRPSQTKNLRVSSRSNSAGTKVRRDVTFTTFGRLPGEVIVIARARSNCVTLRTSRFTFSPSP